MSQYQSFFISASAKNAFAQSWYFARSSASGISWTMRLSETLAPAFLAGSSQPLFIDNKCHSLKNFHREFFWRNCEQICRFNTADRLNFYLFLLHPQLHFEHPQQTLPFFFASICFLQIDFTIKVTMMKRIALTITVPIELSPSKFIIHNF